MAKLKTLPSMDIISGFKGTIDFYVHRGIVCARKWPKSPGHDRAPAVQAGWPAFSWAASNWTELSLEIKQAYNQLAIGSYKTGKDLFMMSFISGDILYLKDA